MKTAFFRKVAESTNTVQTGRYLYEYDKQRKAVHVVDTKGVVDKYVKLTDCEDYAPTTPAPKKAAPKAKATPATTPATPDPVLAALQAIGTALAEQGARLAALEAKVNGDLATLETISAQVVESAPAPKATPKAKSASKAKKEVKPLATHEGKLSKEGKATLKAIQAWAKKTRRPVDIQVNGSWIWVAGTEKHDKEALKNMGFRWRASRQMWSWDDSRLKSA